MKRGDLTRLIRHLLKRSQWLRQNPTRLVFAVATFAPDGYSPNAESITRIYRRIKRERLEWWSD